MFKDYYKTLGILKNAEIIELKKAHRQLALKYHPDKNKESNSHEKFIEIAEDYWVLIDSNQRKVYDEIYNRQFSLTENIKETYSKQQNELKKSRILES